MHYSNFNFAILKIPTFRLLYSFKPSVDSYRVQSIVKCRQNYM